jgi:uncharacterized membrane protein
MGMICGYVIFFGGVIGILSLVTSRMPLSVGGLISGMIEMTSGITMMTGQYILLPIITFLVTFGGASVFMQIKGIVGSTFSMRVFVMRKFLQGVIAVLVYYGIAMMVPISQTVSSSIITTRLLPPRGLLLYAMILSLSSVGVCMMACGSIRDKK